MRSKLKIVAAVVAVVAGMFLYKKGFEKKKAQEKARDREEKKSDRNHWN